MGIGLPALNHASMTRLKIIGKGMQRSSGSSRNPKNRLPVTPTILRRIKEQWAYRPTEYAIIMFWAVAFFGFFRLGEILMPPGEAYDSTSHLSATDVANKIRLKQSKTDEFGKGVMVYIARTDTDLCPIAAIVAFMALRGNNPGPFFQHRDKKKVYE